MRVLITGAAGFLGRHFLAHHLAEGDSITVVDDMSSAGAFWIPGDYVRRPYDFGSFVKEDWGNFDRAYHFAAPVGGRLKIEGDPLYNADSLRLDQAFFRWARVHAGVAIYPSSSAVYGVDFQRDAGMPLSETFFNPAGPNWPKPDELYGLTKMVGEVLAYKTQHYGLSTLVLRPFSGYGEGQSDEYPVTAICKRALAREDPLTVWGSGHQQRDFIHVSDIVGATLAALAIIPKAYSIANWSPLNLGSGVPVSFVEVAMVAASIVGYSPEIVTDPSKPEGVHARFADTRRLERIYKPTVSLHAGLTRVIEHLSR